MSHSEIENVKERYERRKSASTHSLYDPFRTVNLLYRQEREAALTRMLGLWLGSRPLSDIKILEVGCGSGANLLHLITLGALPENILANELLAERVEKARRNLPHSATVVPGDASELTLAPQCLDLVLQSTVFSSLLDSAFRHKLATRMLEWLKPGGCVLWYDFTFDNPRNPDVRGVPLAEIQQLFPGCRITAKRVTLAPPVARKLGALTRIAYPVLNMLPFLRTHVLCVIEKPDK